MLVIPCFKNAGIVARSVLLATCSSASRPSATTIGGDNTETRKNLLAPAFQLYANNDTYKNTGNSWRNTRWESGPTLPASSPPPAHKPPLPMHHAGTEMVQDGRGTCGLNCGDEAVTHDHHLGLLAQNDSEKQQGAVTNL